MLMYTWYMYALYIYHIQSTFTYQFTADPPESISQCQSYKKDGHIMTGTVL